MNKNILVIGLALLALLGLGYGFQQRKLASEAIQQKAELEKVAEEQRQIAAEHQKMAQLAQQEAMVQRTICEEQLKDCKSK
jgi:hypothetical protein